jgi:capsular exopolysaccharide synthesis family protein
MLPELPAALPELNLREYLQIIRRRKVVFIQVFVVVLAIGIVAAMTGKPIYETTAKLLVTAGSSSVSIVDSNNPIATMLAAAQPDSVDTQLQVLQSGPFLDDAYRLAHITPKPNAAPTSVHAQAVENTNVIEITADGGDPKQTADLANAVVKLHLERSDLLTTTGLRDTLQFVRQEKEKAQTTLSTVEKKLAAFRQAHRLVGVTSAREAQAGEYAVLLAQVLEAESNIRGASDQAASLRAQLARAPRQVVEVDTRENPRVAKLQEKLDELNFQRMDLLRDFRPVSRPVRDVSRQIAAVQRQLNAVPRHIQVQTYSANPAIPLLQTRIEELESSLQSEAKLHSAAAAQLAAKKGLMDSLGPWESELTQLTSDRDSARGAYTMLADHLRDLEIRAGARLRTARPIEWAAVPTSPIRPRRQNSLFLAFILALALATGTVFLMEFLDDRVNSPEDWERFSPLPTLAHVPLMSAREPRLVAELPANCMVAEAYRSLRSSVGFAALDGPIRRLQVTSPSKGDGKTTTAVNLATAMARDGKKVILVDADLRSPSIHRVLHLPGFPGLTEVLMGTRSIEESVRTTEIPDLLVLPAGTAAPNAAELLGSRAFDMFLEELGEWADVVIVDTPPCLPVTDPVIIAARMEGVVLVVHAGQTRKAAIKQTLELLGRARARILGVLLNQVAPNSSGYYHYYSYRPYYGSEDEPNEGQRGDRRRRGAEGALPELTHGKSLAARSRGMDERDE